MSGRADKTLTLTAGQTLNGAGTVNGSLLVPPGAMLAPGGATTGTLTVTNGISLNGTTLMKLNGSGNSDALQAGGGVTYGGTLALTNISGGPFAAGNLFHLFTATSYAGTFTKITPAIPALNLAWNTNALAGGLLTVVAQPTPTPQIVAMIGSGNSMVFSGTNGVPGWPYHVLTTTNLASPLATWSPVATNVFDAGGNFTFTNAINSTPTQTFYLLQLQ